MDQDKTREHNNCIDVCETCYPHCMSSREHEPVCGMKNNPRVCGCTLD